jgi:hypothetical protein
MPTTVSLTGTRHTDGTIGRVSLSPRVPWYVSSGSSTVSSGPLYFQINSSGELKTLAGGTATVVPTYDSGSNMTFSPEGAAYLARINISGQEIIETWTIDGVNPTIDWGVLGIKASPADRTTYPVPLTTESPVKHYPSVGSLPGGSWPGAIVYIASGNGEWYGWNTGSGWHKIAG